MMGAWQNQGLNSLSMCLRVSQNNLSGASDSVCGNKGAGNGLGNGWLAKNRYS